MADLKLIKPLGVQNIINKFCLTIGMIPSSYKLSLTYEEQILSIGKYLEETVIPALNNNAEAVAELQALFVQLKDYVENYFDNLDIQNEVNAKLDAMTQSGALAEIINEEIFNELNTSIQNLENKINQTNQNVENTKNLSLQLNENIIKNKQSITSLVVIGDSYGVGYTNNDTIIEGYPAVMKRILNLDDNHFYNNSWGGAGFANVSYDKDFGVLLNEANQTLSEERKKEVSHVLFAGGYNDQWHSKENILFNIKTDIEQAQSIFPNALILVAFIGWRTNNSNLNDTLTAYINGCNLTKHGHFIADAQNILTADLISNDLIHPNQNGYNFLGENLITGIQTLKCSPQSPFKFLKTTDDVNLGIVNINNDLLNFEMYDYEFNTNGTANGNEILFKTLNDESMISGNGNFKINIPCIFVNTNNGSYVNGFCLMTFNQKELKLKPYAINNAGNNYFDFTSIRLIGSSYLIPHQCI